MGEIFAEILESIYAQYPEPTPEGLRSGALRTNPNRGRRRLLLIFSDFL